ncbi:2-methylcitrate dehydratase PrpD [Eremomyces bilateralis CBS 781.70]|uniref:2-methylcitrate dehydratase PrpD n=1 Tax=Eremomyces bilateralis CBS 781.70 TaxID=1392243 RepID=A0A6G1GHS9_9PEZI|nr:2-methylcitrate dehydratase PrpD [Eremomyces bilateralis CBS 781.70]KAF1817564.1 2-methylcitrate dehydratase PrpD [Eremomyces bilateralis CBS 781.70]
MGPSSPKQSAKPEPTTQLSSWISSATLNDIPEEIRVRAKHLILDGLGCGLLGAHLPSSEKAARAIFDLEPVGDATVIGWPDKKLPSLSAALLNSAFIQGFELDDWHSEAPIHSNSILLPALFAAAEHVVSKDNKSSLVSGSDILLATIIGYEVGPRVGLALHGAHVLTTGWHSGAVFGPAVAASAVGKLLGLTPEQIEDAFGVACTQACGLMSAQFGSEVKRMQHGFAARNGLLAAFLAQGGYIGIKRVFEQEYGGFLKQFSSGNGMEPQYLVDELTKDLGVKWQTQGVRVKPYASMAGTHPTIDCVRKLQELYPEPMQNWTSDIAKITIELGEAAFHHGGWKAIRPLTSTGAQMSNAYVAATQIVYGEVLAAQFRHDMLENDNLWRLVDVTDCVLTKEIGAPRGRQTVTVEFKDGTVLRQRVDSARGVEPPLSNQEIIEKWRQITKDVIDIERAEKIERLVLELEKCDDIMLLQGLMGGLTKNPIA